MKNTFWRSGIIAAGLSSGFVIAAPLFQAPASAQTQTTQTQSIVADGRLTEYSPKTAPILRRGSSGPVVRDVQQLLRSRGFYNGAIDGIYGPRTVSSVITFQRSRNLIAQGAVEASTWEALIDLSNRLEPAKSNSLSNYAPSQPVFLSIGSTGQIVRDIQAFLRVNGYYSGALDGVYGTATASAVEAFQQRYSNLTNDGIIGPRTWRAMLDAAN